MTAAEYAKAIAGAATAGGAALGVALADETVTAGEVAVVVLAAVGAFAAVFATPNAPGPAHSSRATPDDAGS